MAAPVTVVVAYDLEFAKYLPRFFPCGREAGLPETRSHGDDGPPQWIAARRLFDDGRTGVD